MADELHKVTVKDQDDQADAPVGDVVEDVKADSAALDAIDNTPGTKDGDQQPVKKPGKAHFNDTDPRKAMAKNYHQARDAETGPITRSIEEPPADTQPKPEAQKVKVKVEGIEREVAIEDLVSNFQKHSAADLRLEQATQKLRDAEQRLAEAERMRAPTKADERAGPEQTDGQPPTDEHQDLPTHKAEANDAELAELLDRINLGTPEEGVNALKKIIETAKAASPQQAVNPDEMIGRLEQRLALRQIQQSFTAADAEFGTQFARVREDDTANIVKERLLHLERLADLKAAGVPDDYIAEKGLDRSPTASLAAHVHLTMQGFSGLRSAKQLYDAVGGNASFRSLVGASASGERNGDIRVNVDRSERKEGMQHQPALRSAAPYARQGDDERTQAQKAASVVANMRQRRGQTSM